MDITIDRRSPIPVYQQIYDQIRGYIFSGTLPPGYRLPPERKLAEQLGVNRSTVLNAYRELKADALVDSRIGQGTAVLSQKEAAGERKPADVPAAPWRQLLSESATRMQQPLVSNILKNANRPDVISFAAGVSASQSDPIEALLETQQRLLRDYGSQTLQYSASEGHFAFRESLCQWMSERGMAVSPEEVVVLAGSQQGIDLAARVLLDPGDIVIVEEPTFFSALQIFQSAGARIMGVPIDRDGMQVDILASLLERYKPKLIYTVPTFQNPSGTVMSLKRRMQLLDLAYRYQVPIIEDDPYSELRYDGDRIPTLKALDTHHYVIYLSSFSKIVFPGLRVGWASAARPLMRQFVLMKQMADLHTNSLGQWLLDDFLRRDLLRKQALRVRDANRQSRDVMTAALREYGMEDFEWETPQGGLYFWCRIPDEVDLPTLMAKAEDRKVIVVPGYIFYPGNGGQSHIRLSFASPPADRVKPGIKALMQVVAELMERKYTSGTSPDPEIRPIL